MGSIKCINATLAPVRDGRVWVLCHLFFLLAQSKNTVIELVFVDVNSAQFDSAQLKSSVKSIQLKYQLRLPLQCSNPHVLYPSLPPFPQHRLVLENPVFFTSFHLPCLLPAPFPTPCEKIRQFTSLSIISITTTFSIRTGAWTVIGMSVKSRSFAVLRLR